MILDHITETFPGCRTYEFSEEDIEKINLLKKGKYSTWEWNFGYSPKYDFEKSFVTNGGNIQVHLNVTDGIIQKARILVTFSTNQIYRRLKN
jgi:lipoate---protein ligase